MRRTRLLRRARMLELDDDERLRRATVNDDGLHAYEPGFTRCFVRCSDGRNGEDAQEEEPAHPQSCSGGLLGATSGRSDSLRTTAGGRKVGRCDFGWGSSFSGWLDSDSIIDSLPPASRVSVQWMYRARLQGL